MLRRFAPAVLALSLAASARASPADAVRIDTVTFAGSLTAGNTPMRLLGAGVFRWGFFLKVYAAALYVADGPNGGFDPAADVARRLELTYLVPVDRGALAHAANGILSGNYTAQALAPLRERIERLHHAFVNLHAGDRAALTYVPGRGTEFTLNGRPIVRIEGADFARAYFSIWLGERPADAGLRRKLLGMP